MTTAPQVVSVAASTRHGVKLTLTRPERGNALDAALVEELETALDVAERSGTRLITITGDGRNFCTGLDLANLDAESDGDLLLRLVRIEQLLQKIYHCSSATAAIASGRAIGAGADLFVACDHRFCLPDASFRFPGAGFGLVLGTRRLASRIGTDAARDILLSGRTVGAEEALRLGLATRVVEAPDVEGAIAQLEQQVIRLDTATVAGLHAAMITPNTDGDLATLVRSAARSGLKARITHYRQATAKSFKPTDP